jgi:hypothetical protein
MSTTVVVEKLGTVVTETTSTQTVVTQGTSSSVIVTGQLGPAGAATFSELRDIDLSQLGSGSLLVYSTATNKWTATTLLDQQTVESGQF